MKLRNITCHIRSCAGVGRLNCSYTPVRESSLRYIYIYDLLFKLYY